MSPINSAHPFVASPSTLPRPVNNNPSDPMPCCQHNVPSRSSTRQVPNTSRMFETSQLASARYVRQFRALLDHQREVFDEERALWQIERSDLEDKISRLELFLRQAQNTPPNQATSPSRRYGMGSSFSSLSAASASQHVSAGDEFWRGAGGKSDAIPTRAFSSDSDLSSGPSQRLASISENEPPQGLRSSSSTSIPKPSIPEHNEGTFDGITFKQASRAPSVTSNGITPQSPSPSHVSPKTLRLPLSRFAPPDEYVTEHAGHTPLAHGLIHGTDGASSAISSATATPTEPQKERPPNEPHASFARPPSERSDSYFTGIIADTAEDPAMSAPLGLGDSNTSEDKSFLDQVDSRLEEAVSEQNGSSSVDKGTSREPDVLTDPPEDPPLRIKRSMNFGSQLGGSRGF